MEGLWIARLQIAPMRGNCAFEDPESTGGFINAVAYALDEQQFREKVLRSLSEYGVRLVAFENASPINDPLEISQLEPRLIEAIRQLSVDEDARFGTLFCYKGD